ncbi:MAG: hypothetical protein Q4G28_00340 [Neisseria sp.]|nr:hypothetical protein [Neisseria sp.]
MPTPATPRLLTPQPYRNLAALIAIVGSLLLWRYHADAGIAALAAVVLLFAGALSAIAAVFLALRLKDSATTVQSLLLLLWQVGFPLVLLSRLYHAAM